MQQPTFLVAIHNKNGKGLLRRVRTSPVVRIVVAIHNKNGKGLLLTTAMMKIGTCNGRNPQ